MLNNLLNGTVYQLDLSLDSVLLVIISICAAYVIYEIMDFIIKKIFNHKMFRLRMKQRREEINIKEYYPVVLGAIIGFTIMSNYIYWAPAAAFIGGMVGFLIKKLFEKIVHKLNEDKKAGEVLLLYEIVSKYATSNYPLPVALSGSVYLTNLIREPLQKCVDTWKQGPQRALKRMGEEINTPESEALVSILLRAFEVGPANMAELLTHESEVMERLRNMRVEQGFSTRLIIQTMYLILPGLALVGVTLVAIGYHLQKAIMSIRLS